MNTLHAARPFGMAAILLALLPAMLTAQTKVPIPAHTSAVSPKPPKPKPGGGLGDGIISQKVRHALILDRRFKPWKVGVVSSSATVILKGTVQTAQARGFAEDDARKVSGVLRVVNRLKIAP